MAEQQAAAVTFRTDTRPGDLGRLITLHADVFCRQYSFNSLFELAVVRSILDACDRSVPVRFIVAEEGDQIRGLIGVLEHSLTEARLRWFVVQPDWQGRGIGGRLLQMALDHCRQKGYQKIWLQTFSCLEQARRLYERFRFVLVDSSGFNRWGDALVQERWELDLSVLPSAG